MSVAPLREPKLILHSHLPHVMLAPPKALWLLTNVLGGFKNNSY
jgi:hypothetical protein